MLEPSSFVLLYSELASLFLVTEAAEVFTERFKGASPLLLLVDKSSTLLLEDLVE